MKALIYIYEKTEEGRKKPFDTHPFQIQMQGNNK